MHSLYRPGSYLTGDYWDEPLVLPLLRPPTPAAARSRSSATPRARRHAPTGTSSPTPRRRGRDRRRADRARPPLLRPAQSAPARCITEDARPFLRQPGARYDAIIVDAYRQPYIPFYLTTREFFAEVRSHLAPRGVVIVNVGHPPGSDSLEKVLAATMQTNFQYVRRDPADDVNTWLVGSGNPIRRSGISRVQAGLQAPLRPLAAQVSARIALPLLGGSVYTDDRAPVEWLVDQSLLDYAAGRR